MDGPFQAGATDAEPDLDRLRAALAVGTAVCDAAERGAAAGAHAQPGQTAPPRRAGPPGQAPDIVQSRLDRLAERFERAAARLERTLHAAAPDPPAAAAPATDAPSSDLATAEMLAREADHRIGNNLQVVATLLHRQAQGAETDDVRAALTVAGSRIAAIGMLHAALHGPSACAAGPAELELGGYLAGLCETLAHAMGAGQDGRSVLVEMQPRVVAPVVAQRLGLVVTELVTNALRHALPPGRAGTVRVQGRALPEGGYRLCVEDDGCGLPGEFDLQSRRPGLGLRVALMCADQLRARLVVEPPAVGTRFALTLPPPGS